MPGRCWKCGALPEEISSLPVAQVVDVSSAAFTHLINSNDVPLDREVPEIHHIIANSQDRLDALDSQIDSLHATLAQLVRRRDEMAEDVHKHKAVLSPVRRVPPELLCAIFWMALPFTRRVQGRANGDLVTQAPWHLGQVCRKWRETALAYPHLWSSIHIVHPPRPLRFRDIYPQPMLETQLQRSGSRPLDVVLECHGDLGLEGSVVLASDRWRTLSVRVAGLGIALGLLSVAQGHLSVLEMLDLIDDTVNWSSAPSNIFLAAPSLRAVILTDARLRQHSPPLVLPWHQITHYRGTYKAERQLEILRAAPCLVQCSLSFSNTVRPAGQEIIILPVLRRLYLRQALFLNLLNAPLLEELFVEDFSIDTILPFVERSSCQLTKLVLLDCTISAAASALRSIPTLTDFHIRTYDPAEQISPSHLFAAMTISASQDPLCPRLTSFSFGIKGGISTFAGCADAFVGMVQSRSPPISQSRLSCVRLYWQVDAPPDELAQGVKLLTGEGFDVAFLGRREGEKWVENQCF
ncbi:hypothetical protein FB451DRAFT_1096843 [Mycena latifolia]|nr:hypothetical protein FB451DRAFT_1096843 [Mycena latifolia]